MINRLIRLARPHEFKGRTTAAKDTARQEFWADLEDAMGVVSLFVLLFLGLTFSGSI